MRTGLRGSWEIQEGTCTVCGAGTVVVFPQIPGFASGTAYCLDCLGQVHSVVELMTLQLGQKTAAETQRQGF